MNPLSPGQSGQSLSWGSPAFTGAGDMAPAARIPALVPTQAPVYEVTNFLIPPKPAMVAHAYSGSEPVTLRALPHEGIPGVSSAADDLRVKTACVNCKLAKTRCDNKRPCRRCVRTGRADTCIDSVHKTRGRKRPQPRGAKQRRKRDTRARAGSPAAAPGPAAAPKSFSPGFSMTRLSSSPAQTTRTMYGITYQGRRPRIDSLSLPDPSETPPGTAYRLATSPVTAFKLQSPALPGPMPAAATLLASMSTGRRATINAAGNASGTDADASSGTGQSSPPLSTSAIFRKPSPDERDTAVFDPLPNSVPRGRRLSIEDISRYLGKPDPATQSPSTADADVAARSSRSESRDFSSSFSGSPVVTASSAPARTPKLSYVEYALTICNKELEQWNSLIFSSRKGQRGVGSAAGDAKSGPHPPHMSFKAYQWLASCMLKNLNQAMKAGSGDNGTTTAAASPALVGTRRQPIDPREVFFGTLPIGVVVLSLQPSPFQPANRPWVNRGMADYLGYPQDRIRNMLMSLKGVSALYPASNLPSTVRLFMDALCHRKENYSSESRWICADGTIISVLESIALKYSKSGVPLSATLFIQKIAGERVGERRS